MPTFIHGYSERTAELTNTNLLTWGAPAKCVREAGKGDKVQGLSKFTGNQAGVRRSELLHSCSVTKGTVPSH